MSLKRDRSDPTDTMEQQIVQYLNEKNRPYGVADLMANLPGQIKKGPITKALDNLSSKGDIVAKKTGNKTIYWAIQNSIQGDNMMSMEDMDRQAHIFSEENTMHAEAIKKLESQIREFAGVVSLESLQRKIVTKKTEIEAASTKLSHIENAINSSNNKSKREPKQLQKDLDTFRKHYKARKALFLEIFNTILEHSTVKKKKLMEDIGIEDDEEAGFDPKEWATA